MAAAMTRHAVPAARVRLSNPVQSPVAHRIRALIVDGTLAPGARVAEATIADMLGVSRTPVRNALPALASEGLLEPHGRRGYSVRRFTFEDSLRGTELRCVLEGYAARKVTERGPYPELMSELRDCLAEGDRLFGKGHLTSEDGLDYGAMNKRFHNAIVNGSDDPILIDMIERVYALPFVDPGVVAFNVPLEELFPALLSGHYQHHAMVDAIAAGQAEVAESVMRSHSTPARKSLTVNSDSAARANL